MKKLSDVLQSSIEMQDLKQKKVAEQLNMAPQTFNSYVKGHRYPDVESLRSIAVYFNLDINDLMDLNPDKNKCLISNKQEAKLIKLYRQLDEEDKSLGIDILSVMAARKNHKDE